jgi:hypothetical protein
MEKRKGIIFVHLFVVILLFVDFFVGNMFYIFIKYSTPV